MFKKRFKKELDANINLEDFDVNSLNIQKVKKTRNLKKKLLIGIPSFLVAVSIISTGTVFAIKYENSKKPKDTPINKEYTLSEVKVMEEAYFQRINNFEYPSVSNLKELEKNYSKEEIDNYASYSDKVFKALKREENISFSPVTLYSVLNQISLSTNDTEITTLFNDLLGNINRTDFYKKVFESNFYEFPNGFTKMYNALFSNSHYKSNQECIDDLTKVYTEVYNADFQDERAVQKMINWVNQALNEKMIDKKWLEMSDDTICYFFSTLNFNHRWAPSFNVKDSYKDSFYYQEGESKQVTFMHKKYMTQSYYDYGTYYSVKDYYSQKCSVTYLFPKSDSDEYILDLISDNNIFLEDEDYLIKNDDYAPIVVNLSLPKFSYTTDLNLKNTLKHLGFEKIFDNESNVLNRLYNPYDNGGLTTYIDIIKQRNKVSFSEDGTTIRSVSVASGGPTSTSSIGTIEANLNRPFIYIIKDTNDIPLFVGVCDNPVNEK